MSSDLYPLMIAVTAVIVPVVLLVLFRKLHQSEYRYKLEIEANRVLNSQVRAVTEKNEQLTKAIESRPHSIEAQEILHDLTAHGKAMVLIQRVGLDEILLRPRRGD